MVTVRRLDVEDWPLLRNVRLGGMLDAPYAFASDHERESALTEHDWRRRFVTTTWFLAWDGDEPVGMVACTAPGRHERELASLWVAPSARGHGTGSALIDAVVHEAARQGARSLRLRVNDANAAARRLYERSGFVRTTEREPHHDDTTGHHDVMRHDLTGVDVTDCRSPEG